MGLLAKLKELPRPFSHNRNNTQLSVGDFLLTTSNLSYSSTDLHPAKVHDINKIPVALQPSTAPGAVHLLPDPRSGHARSPVLSQGGRSSLASPQVSPLAPHNRRRPPALAVYEGTARPFLSPQSQESRPFATPAHQQGPVQTAYPVQPHTAGHDHPAAAGAPVHAGLRRSAAPATHPGYTASVQVPALESTPESSDSAEESETGSADATSEIDDGSEYESEADDLANGIPRDHPYYHQWKQYYADMAKQNQPTNMHQQYPLDPQLASNHLPYQNMNPNFNPNHMNHMSMGHMNPQMQMQFNYFMQQFMMQQPQMMQMFQQPMQMPAPYYASPGSQSPGSPQLTASKLLALLLPVKKRHSMASFRPENDSNLLLNSRRSTIKSNRYPSVPLSLYQSALVTGDTRNRISSLDLNFKPKESRRASAQVKDTAKDVTIDSSDPGHEQLQRYVSDYSKFLFDDDDDEADEKELAPPKELGVERQELNASTGSYNLIQSGASSKFRVGSTSERSSKIAQELSDMHIASIENEKKKNRKGHSLKVENTRASNPNLASVMSPPSAPMAMNSNSNSPVSPMQPMAGNQFAGGPDYFADFDRRHNADVSRMSMMMPPMPMAPMGNMGPIGSMGNGMGNRMSMMPGGRRREMLPTPRSGDATVNKKIDEFVELRQLIASGKKSSDFRLKWLKMLIRAINYRVYAYINIKGEPVLADQVGYSKTQFIKSAVTHLQKLTKEFDNRPNFEEMESEVCYIHGCLLMGDYHYTYGQDFAVAKDIGRALGFFERSLMQNANNFKTLYKLGELYQREFPDRFDTAVNYYKSSAKLGYNRAIYKMAMLYLEEPALRLIKFFKLLRQLADIDLESKDIKLSEEDRDELEEVVGIASYQVGKIYEGIYPGDLTEDDPFVTQALSRAPISYTKSLSFYNRSAKLNCILAQVKLGTVYENGDLNRQVNPHKSVQWYMLAASSPLSFRRHQDAMLGLSRWCLHGTNGLSKHIPGPNPEKAVWWCEQALEEFQLPDAYFFMGHLCDMGLTGRDSRIFYKRAMDLGHPHAALILEGNSARKEMSPGDMGQPEEEQMGEGVPLE